MIDHHLERERARAIIDAVKRAAPGANFLGATVTSPLPNDYATGTIEVHLDGDTTTATVTVPLACAQRFANGSRVLVASWPPAGMAVVGPMGPDPGWTAYTPSWTGSVTNPAIGNGTLTGRYALFGKTLHYRIHVIPGSTTTFGSGTYSLTLPYPTCATPSGEQAAGVGYVLSPGVNRGRFHSVVSAGASALSAVYNDTGSPWTAVAPFTFANGHTAALQGTVEIA